MYKVYGDLISGNCYKVKLLLTQLDIPHVWQHVDILQSACQTTEFLAKNPNGKVPLLEIESDVYLSESNAILYYLAENTPLFPQQCLQQAQIMQWLFFEQYSHEPYIAVARFIKQFSQKPETEKQSLLTQKYNGGIKALQVMEQHLQARDFFVAQNYSIADIALYAYTHIADEGGFDLTPFPAVRRWLENVRRQSRYISMPNTNK